MMRLKINLIDDPEQQRLLWERHWPQEGLFDQWEVRRCFAEPFARRHSFVTLENRGNSEAMLPLSWLEESACYGFFPGEAWQGQTWLEQNRLCASSAAALELLLEQAPGPLQLRYISAANGLPQPRAVDEWNYACFPAQYGFSFASFRKRLSCRFIRQMGRNIERLESRGLSFRENHAADLQVMFEMNLAAFRQESYFSDPRFIQAFEKLAHWLRQENRLRLVTVLVCGKIAAVDLAAVCNNGYTILAGGTNPEFPGVAKYINLHHLEWGFSQRMHCIDFLCGDFGWKSRLGLDARPYFAVGRT